MTLREWLGSQCQPAAAQLQWLLDAQVNDPHQPTYVIAERKTQATPSYRLHHALTHGFGLIKWRFWQQGHRPVWLVVAETRTGDLLALRIDGTRYDTWFDGDRRGVDPGGMVYLRRDRFAIVATFQGQQSGFQPSAELAIASAASAVRVLERCADGFAEGPASLARARSSLEAVKAANAPQTAVAPSQGELWGDAEKPQLDAPEPRKPSWL